MIMDPERGSAQYSSSVQSTPIEKLNDSNYATWSFQMKLVLMDSDLWTTDKSTRQPFETRLTDERKGNKAHPLDLVHCDLMGPVDVCSFGGARNKGGVLRRF
uniref:DUF4219 domain-containing protein n=1 Tax=Trichuris muris TaxID=70415 RepID=A0A5S6QGI9_TRIMR